MSGVPAAWWAICATLGGGLWLVLLGQPLGRPRPDLARSLRRLTAAGRVAETRATPPPLFGVPALERTLRPVLDDVGAVCGALLTRAGIESGDLGRRLALAMPGVDPAQFRGQQLASAAVAGGLLPLLNLLGVELVGPWPVWTWLLAAGVGFAAPSWVVRARLRQRRHEVLAALPVALDLFALAASAGLSPEQALVEAGARLDGVLGDELRAVARAGGLGTTPYGAGLRALAEQEDVTLLRSLAEAWSLARDQGLPLGPAMLALAASAREQERAQLLEQGGTAAVRMLFPIALFIFPVFLVVLLYPAGVALLGVRG